MFIKIALCVVCLLIVAMCNSCIRPSTTAEGNVLHDHHAMICIQFDGETTWSCS